MLKRHILALATASILTSPLSAATLKVGPEVPLSPRVDLRAAAYDQALPAVASNGGDFLVVWTDYRGTAPAIYATRAGSDGHPFTPIGVRIAAGTRAVVAPAGGADYLVVWVGTDGGLNSQRLDLNGAAVAPPRAINGSGVPRALVWNGSTFLLVTVKDEFLASQLVTAVVLDAGGAVLRTAMTSPNRWLAAGVHDGRHAMVDLGQDCRSGGCTYSPALHLIGNDGSVSDVALPSVASQSNLDFCATLSPAAIFIAWEAPHRAFAYRIVGFDGRAISDTVSLADIADFLGGSFPPAAGWDGRDFLLVFSEFSFVASALRISADGTPLDRPPFVLTSKPRMTAPVFAASGATQLIVWPDVRFGHGQDIAARAVATFDDLALHRDEATLLSYSPEAQIDVQMARNAAGQLMSVWSDESHQAISGALGGIPIAVDVPADAAVLVPTVGAGARTFLVVWQRSSAARTLLLGKRFDFNGRDLDGQPVMLASNSTGTAPAYGEVPSIGFDGSSFLIAWTNQNLYTIRIGEEGAPFDLRETVLGTGLFAPAAHSPHVLPAGSEFFIPYSLQRLAPVDPSVPLPAAIGAVRLGPTASTDPLPVLFDDIAVRQVRIAAAASTDKVTFAWRAYRFNTPCILVAQSSLAGAPLLGPTLVAGVSPNSSEYDTRTALGWDGAGFVLVWTEPNPLFPVKLRAMRLSRDGAVIDEPFDIATGIVPSTPSVVRTPSGVLVAYSRVDQAGGGAPRAFVRAIDRLPLPPRRRGVGH
jgi:hypothetical protein